MNDYYVVWSVYNGPDESSDVLNRAIITASSAEAAKGKANDLVAKVIQHYDDTDGALSVDEEEVEVTVTLLETWIQELRMKRITLENLTLDEE